MKYMQNLRQHILNVLVRVVCWRVSNLSVFNAAFFCFSADEYDDDDLRFKRALGQELFRRGLLTTPEVQMDYVLFDNVIADKFRWEMECIDLWFACDRNDSTAEDWYVELFTGRDRLEERKQMRRAVEKAKREQKQRAAKKSANQDEDHGPTIGADDL